jgi:hypothetical protein
MLDAAILGDLLMVGIVIDVWAVAILVVAMAFDAVRKVIRGY